MEVSAEIRWFWKAGPPPGLQAWFVSEARHPCAPGGGQKRRTDRYRRDAEQEELGIKLRGSAPGCEVKGLVAVLAPLSRAPFVGPGQVWTKWSTEALRFEPDELVATTKLRWIRKLDTKGSAPREVALGPDEGPLKKGDEPETGCQVELTRILFAEQEWWSFSFESFGTLATVERDLHAGAAAMAERQPPALTGGTLASYPAWLKDRLAAG